MSRLKLTIATTDYDHFRDFRLGLVNAEGIDHAWPSRGVRPLHLQPRMGR
jgi:4,5-dihydroxyphthalate decarboxylase